MQATLEPLQATTDVRMLRSQQSVIGCVLEIMEDIQADYVADKRSDPRCPVCVPLEVTPYNRQGQRTGKSFRAVTKDVSASGIAFLHTAEFVDRFAVVRFPGVKRHANERIVVQVLRCREVGPLWEIGGRFVVEWRNPRESEPRRQSDARYISP
jgi:hypothetical protein